MTRARARSVLEPRRATGRAGVGPWAGAGSLPALLAQVRDLLEAENRARAESAVLADAIMRYETSGAGGAPMNARHVAALLGIGASGVHNLVSRGLLRKRWDYATACFHPDDVRAYLSAAKGGRGAKKSA